MSPNQNAQTGHGNRRSTVSRAAGVYPCAPNAPEGRREGGREGGREGRRETGRRFAGVVPGFVQQMRHGHAKGRHVGVTEVPHDVDAAIASCSA